MGKGALMLAMSVGNWLSGNEFCLLQAMYMGNHSRGRDLVVPEGVKRDLSLLRE